MAWREKKTPSLCHGRHSVARAGAAPWLAASRPLPLSGYGGARWKWRMSGRALVSVEHPGHGSVMSDANSPAGPIWLTYKQAAERLGLSSPNAAEAKAKRERWPQRLRDDTGEIEIAAPPELLTAGSKKPQKSRQAFPAVSPAAAASPALADVVRAAGAPLEAVIERQELANKALQTALDVARAETATADAARRIRGPCRRYGEAS